MTTRETVERLDSKNQQMKIKTNSLFIRNYCPVKGEFRKPVQVGGTLEPPIGKVRGEVHFIQPLYRVSTDDFFASMLLLEELHVRDLVS